MTIVLRNSISLDKDLKLEIQCFAENVLDYIDHANTEVVICFVNERTIKELNWQYRKLNESTDVLSFPYNEIDSESGRMYLGDIVISLERANSQAAEKGWNLIKEIQLLIVHGILHLLEYDHEKVEDSEQMYSKQNEILENLD